MVFAVIVQSRSSNTEFEAMYMPPPEVEALLAITLEPLIAPVVSTNAMPPPYDAEWHSLTVTLFMCREEPDA